LCNPPSHLLLDLNWSFPPKPTRVETRSLGRDLLRGTADAGARGRSVPQINGCTPENLRSPLPSRAGAAGSAAWRPNRFSRSSPDCSRQRNSSNSNRLRHRAQSARHRPRAESQRYDIIVIPRSSFQVLPWPRAVHARSKDKHVVAGRLGDAAAKYHEHCPSPYQLPATTPQSFRTPPQNISDPADDAWIAHTTPISTTKWDQAKLADFIQKDRRSASRMKCHLLFVYPDHQGVPAHRAAALWSRNLA